MFNLFAALRKDRLRGFDGGIYPPEMKAQSSGTPLRHVPLPDNLVIPLKQHLGPEGELCVAVGQRVLRGQPLTRGRGRTLPVHAPTSGVIKAITPHITAHPSALAELSIVLRADGEDCWTPRHPPADLCRLSPEWLLERIHQAGIAGLGGAGFPTAAKIAGDGNAVEILIINAAECEPYITADDRLMRERAQEIVRGIDVVVRAVAPRRILIGIEDNKPAAAAALAKALVPRPDYLLRVVPTKYPSGGAKQLTKILTGREVPFGGHSAAIGVLMLNVGTVFAIKRAVIDDEALTERVVTLTGGALEQPGNVWGRIGTPVGHLLQHAGFTPEPGQMVVMGGPLMGFTLPSLDVPIVKISNCIMAPSAGEMAETRPEQACIRCSQCADACPAGLLPQQLYWFSRGQEHDKARQHHLFDCIECGACAYVCPSNIPLVHYYRREKAEIRTLDRAAEKAAAAKARYEAKLARREREKAARELRHRQAAVKPDDMAPTIAPKGLFATGETPLPPVNKSDDVTTSAHREQQDAVAAAIARVKARKAAAKSSAATDENKSGGKSDSVSSNSVSAQEE